MNKKYYKDLDLPENFNDDIKRIETELNMDIQLPIELPPTIEDSNILKNIAYNRHNPKHIKLIQAHCKVRFIKK